MRQTVDPKVYAIAELFVDDILDDLGEVAAVNRPSLVEQVAVAAQRAIEDECQEIERILKPGGLMPRKDEGKYAAVLADRNLPRLPPADASYQAKVDQLKTFIVDRQAVQLADNYIKWRREKARIEEMLSAANLQLAAYEQLLEDSQERGAAGWGDYGVKENALRLPSGATVRVQREPYGKVVDKEAFRQWCIANGYANQLQLWPSTMNGIVKERLLAGEREPDGTEAYSYTKIVLVKGGEE